MNHFGLIANPVAGRNMGRIKAEEIKALLVSRGMKVSVRYTSEGEPLDDLVRKAADMAEALVVIGGDGTVNQVINGMMNQAVTIPLAIYPMGTVNDFATYMEIPKDPEAFAAMLEIGKIRSVDVGRAGERYFLNVAAGGMLPELAHRVSPHVKTVLGKFAYYMEGVREFPRQFFHPIPVEIERAGKVEQKKILFFLVANSPFVGGFKNLVPEARIDDGLLDLLIVESVEFPSMLNALMHLVRNRIEMEHKTVKGLSFHQVSDVRIGSPESIDLDVDGEWGGRLPVDIKVFSKAIKMIGP